MKANYSFTVLLSSIAFGAVVGSVVHPGIPEIAIVWAIAVGLYYGFRRLSFANAKATT